MSRPRTSEPTELPQIPRPSLSSQRPGLRDAVKDVVKDDNQRLRDRAVLVHLPLIHTIAMRFRRKFRERPLDMIQAGISGLVEASRNYDPEKPDEFEKYAKAHIRSAIRNSLLRKPVARFDGPKLRLADLPEPTFPEMLAVAVRQLPEVDGRVARLYYTEELTENEISRELGIDESRVAQIRQTALEKMALSLAVMRRE